MSTYSLPETRMRRNGGAADDHMNGSDEEAPELHCAWNRPQQQWQRKRPSIPVDWETVNMTAVPA